MAAPDQSPDRIRALQSVLAGAAAVARGRGAPQAATKKAHQDYVTDIDLAVDDHLQAALPPLAPGLPVLSEERAVTVAGPCPGYWVVDPVDGTGNLIAGLPFVGISVALVDAAGPLLAGVLALDEGRAWLAARGQGAWTGTADGALAPLTLPAAPPDLVVLSTGVLDALMAGGDGTAWAGVRAVGKIRNLGAQSLHLASVAAGRLAAVASIEARVWDEAAGGLVLREAGGLWHSAADAADWTQPAAVMAIRAQKSLACHPAVAGPLAAALGGVLGAAAAAGMTNGAGRA